MWPKHLIQFYCTIVHLLGKKQFDADWRENACGLVPVTITII